MSGIVHRIFNEHEPLFRDAMSHTGRTNDAEIELGTLLGVFIAETKPKRFIQVGSRLAIPSLTLAQLGYMGMAYDNNPKYATEVPKLIREMELNLYFSASDFFSIREEGLRAGTMIIADRLSNNLERKVADYALHRGFDLTIMPECWNPDKYYSRRWQNYVSQMKALGYSTDTVSLSGSGTVAVTGVKHS